MPATDVSATLRYLTPTDRRPVYYASRAGADAHFDLDVGFEERTVRIHDARAHDIAADLDRQGFTRLDHPSPIDDFYALDDDGGAPRQRYERAIIDLVCAHTGGADALVFDHTLRSDSANVRGARTTREPAGFIHNDYTEHSAHTRLRELVPPERRSDCASRRFAIVNVWRSIRGPAWRSPITCCDAATIAPGDLIAAERRAADRIGEIEFVQWNPAHRWYYYPGLQTDEVLLIKTFDAATDGRATRSIHTAFDNPLAAGDTPPRESMESRLMVFF